MESDGQRLFGMNRGFRGGLTCRAMAIAIAVASAVFCNCTLFGGSNDEFVPHELTGRAEDILANMKLEHKIAQMVVARLEGTVLPNSNDQRLIGVHGLGGVIPPSLGAAKQAEEYINWIRKAATRNPRGVAPFVVLEHPAGLGGRMPAPATSFPRPLAQAAGADIEKVRELAGLAGTEMRGLGVTMVLGPVADVCDRADRPAMSLNCFGSDPSRVAEMVAGTVSGYQGAGVVAAVSHFPGLGSCDQLPNVGMPIVVKPLLTFAPEDLAPFKRAVREGAAALLVSHVVVPAVDSSLAPASMSRPLLTDLLRDSWAFDGLVIAGAMDQRAISSRYPPGEASIRAIEAGADMIIWRSGYSRYMATIQALLDAVVAGRINVKQVDASVLRILRTKEAYGLLGPEFFLREPNDESLGSKQAVQAAQRGARYAVTLLKNDGGLLPLDPRTVRNVGLVSLVGSEQLRSSMKRFGVEARLTDCYAARLTKWNPDSASISRAVRMARGSDVVLVTIVTASGSIPRGQKDLLRQLARTQVPVVGLVMGVPVDVEQDDTIRAAVAAYAFAGRGLISEPALDAAVECIFGKAAVRLVPPSVLHAEPGRPVSMDFRSMSFSPPGILPVRLPGRSPSAVAGVYFPAGMENRIKWDFGDGDRSRGISVTHEYELPGVYAASVTCQDPFGEETRAEFNVEVGE